MPEGLSATEAHERGERFEREGVEVPGRTGRTVQVLEAVLLSLVTITAAWSGFAAAKWGTEAAQDRAAASSYAIQANRAEAEAQANRTFDASTFNAWFTAWTLKNTAAMEVAERRFRPEFAVAFDAWMKTDPLTNPQAPKGPTYMAEYRLPEAETARELNDKAHERTVEALTAGATGDNYVRVTVVLAGVLFLVGIGSTFSLPWIRFVLLGVGTILLLIGFVLIAGLPAPPA